MLRVLLIFLIIILLLRLIVRNLMPIIFKKLIDKYGGQFQQYQWHNNQTNENQSNREGEVSIDDSKVNKKSSYSDKGDYIDYEEMK